MSIREKISASSMPEPNSGCILWCGAASATGYGTMRWEGRTLSVHRVAWELAKGPIPAGLLVCHKCDVRMCINPDHLWLGTPGDNWRDCITKGRNSRGRKHGEATHHSEEFQRAMLKRRGENSPVAKLTQQEARTIFDAAGTHADIARRFSVSESLVSLIKAKRLWKVLHA